MQIQRKKHIAILGGSVEEMLELNKADVLSLIQVDYQSKVVADSRGGVNYHYNGENNQLQSSYFQTYVDCIGQPALSFKHFPYKSLLKDQQNRNLDERRGSHT